MSKLKFILPAIAALLVAAVVAGVVIAKQPSKVEKAYDECKYILAETSLGSFQLADGGHSILVSATTTVKDLDGVDCLTDVLDTPRSTIANIGSTTSMMGRQTEVHDGLTYAWSYHPDNGLNMTITDE